MAFYPRLMLQVAATAGAALMLATAVPAVAAEAPVSVRETAAPASAAPSRIKRHASRGIRITASHHDRRLSSIRSDLGCSGIWCGRQFVLMIGVGY
jgi:hypothetical protein